MVLFCKARDGWTCVCVCFLRYKRSSLKILGTVGEPINPEAWQWYYSVVGEKRCPIVDTFWQTETVGLHYFLLTVFRIGKKRVVIVILNHFGIQKYD